MSWQIEFPNFPAAEMPAIPEGFEDMSWGADSCPSFVCEKAGLVIFVEPVDPAKRGEPELPRFNLIEWADGANGVMVAEGEEWGPFLAAVNAALAVRMVAP